MIFKNHSKILTDHKLDFRSEICEAKKQQTFHLLKQNNKQKTIESLKRNLKMKHGVWHILDLDFYLTKEYVSELAG